MGMADRREVDHRALPRSPDASCVRRASSAIHHRGRLVGFKAEPGRITSISPTTVPGRTAR